MPAPQPLHAAAARAVRADCGSATPNFFSAERVDLLTAIAGALGALIERPATRRARIASRGRRCPTAPSEPACEILHL